jgi:acyl transferase domain-containing protein/acyl carrier protein
VDWPAVLAPLGGRPVSLPTYPFQRERFWLEAEVLPDRGAVDLEALADDTDADVDEASRATLRAMLPALSAWQGRKREREARARWVYETVWQPIEPPRPAEDGLWRVVGGDDALAEAVVRALAGSGRRASREAEGSEVVGIVSLVGAHPADERDPTGAMRATLAKLRELPPDARIWLVTRGAVGIGPADPLDQPFQALLWGLGRALALEQPDRWGGLVDLPPRLDAAALERIGRVIGGEEDQIAVRAAGTFAPRLVRRPAGRSRERWEPRGTVLLSGGTGAVGSALARWLVGRGATHLALIGRRGPEAPGASVLAEELRALGPRVDLVACDLADQAAVVALIERLDLEGPPVRSVFHAAGRASSGPLAALDDPELAETLAGKVLGAHHLHRALGERPLDAFVAVSSLTGVLGNLHQGAYAAANVFLDALAHHRRARGLAATAIAFGPWADGGMVDERTRTRMEQRGLHSLDPERAVSALGEALDRGDGAVTIADIAWDRFVPVFAAARSRPILASLPEARQVEVPRGTGEALRLRLRLLPDFRRLEHIVWLVRTEAAAVLGCPVERLEPRAGFAELGMDSIMALELRQRLQVSTGASLPPTLAMDHPSCEHVATLLLAALDLAPHAPARVERAVAGGDPVAIVGIGLRLPGGVVDLESLRRLLASDRDAVGPVPPWRWDAEAVYDPDPERKDRSYVRTAAFADDVDRFDAAFFGISPREARLLDPQHRLLLECAWEALEDAGVVPATLVGSRTGVYVGIGRSEYEPGRIGGALEPYAVTGTPASFAAGRLAYILGLQGPTLALDTACSSSMVALHLAVRALRSGECDLALAAGAQVMCGPEAFVALSRLRALAPDGRSKTFSGAADGYGRGEGVVVVALQRLSEATVDGRRVLGVVRGTSTNHDGASSGLTVPNGRSQRQVIRDALTDAGLAPAAIDAVECHGTGTSLGDPIEVQALAEVYGAERPADRPLRLGALKTRIGHLESAAGLAGVASVLASFRTAVLPASLHTSPLNPHLSWDRLPVRVLDQPIPWIPADGAPRRAAVSAFGLSGTNAHVVLEEPPTPLAAPSSVVPGPVILSARSALALRSQARRLRDRLAADPGLELADVAFTLATARSRFAHRAAVVGRDRGATVRALEALAAGEPAQNLIVGEARTRGKVALLFAGQGSQLAGMGGELYAAFPAFREALDEVCAWFAPDFPKPLQDVMFGDECALLDGTIYVQPAVFAFEVALFRGWERVGLVPDVVVGHSIGEIAAAHVAGVLSIEDAVKWVIARTRLTGEAPPGAMIAIDAAAEEVTEQTVDVAAVNGPRSTVISGDEAAVIAVARRFERLGRRWRRLPGTQAFHSAQMDGALDELARVARSLRIGPARIPIVSTVGNADLGSPEHWVRHVRQPVRFLDAMRTLDADGVDVFLEIGPQGVLCGLGADGVSERTAREGTWLPARRKDRSELDALHETAGRLDVRGFELDWRRLVGGRWVELPTYAFQRERHWVEREPARIGAPVGRYGLAGARLELPDGAVLHTLEVGPGEQPELADHLVYGREIAPGALFVAILLAVAATRWPGRPFELTGVEFRRVLVFDGPEDRVVVQVLIRPDGTASATTRTATGEVVVHAIAAMRLLEAVERRESLVAAELPARDLADVADTLRSLHIDWGPRWWRIREAGRVGERTARARFEASSDGPVGAAVLDNVFALLVWAFDAPSGDGVPLLPFGVERVVWYGAPGWVAWAEHCVREAGSASIRSDLALWDAGGEPLGHFEGVTFQRAPAEALLPRSAPAAYAVTWVAAPMPTEAASGWVRVEEVGGMAEPIPGTLVLELRSPVRALASVQAWLADPRLERSRLVVVTRGALAAIPGDPVPDLEAAPIWGLMATLLVEHPERSSALLDLDSLDLLPAALALGHPQVAGRGGRLLVPRLVPATGSAAPARLGGGTVLITGGTGGLGALIARHLVGRHGARRLVLASRRAAGAEAIRHELEAMGAEVRIERCDVAEPAELDLLLASIPDLEAVVHAAGVLDDGLLDGLTEERLARVLRPKVDGALALHRKTRNLQTFIMFSSAAGALGSPGQGSYAAANAFLDALAAHRRAEGLPAASLGWGPWDEVGLAAARPEADRARVRRLGMTPLTVPAALSLFDRALELPQAHLVLAHIERSGPVELGPPMLRRTASGAGVPVAALGPRLAEIVPAQRRRFLLEFVRSEIALVLGLPGPSVVPADRPLQELGLDSLMALELRNRFTAASGLRLAATVLFNHPTPAKLAELLHHELLPETPAEEARPDPIDAMSADELIAMVLGEGSINES